MRCGGLIGAHTHQLCRGVDELCTKQRESRDALFVKLTAMKEGVDSSHSQIEAVLET
jgi:hypothetical protein